MKLFLVSIDGVGVALYDSETTALACARPYASEDPWSDVRVEPVEESAMPESLPAEHFRKRLQRGLPPPIHGYRAVRSERCVLDEIPAMVVVRPGPKDAA